MGIGIVGSINGLTSAMITMESILFIVIISLLLVHEMDAIRAKEWKMFIVLKDMEEEAAYKFFVLIHLPLYVVAFYILYDGGIMASYVLKIVIDIFLLVHAIIHYGFRNHSHNGFKSIFSKNIIYSMSGLALLHLCLLLAL